MIEGAGYAAWDVQSEGERELGGEKRECKRERKSEGRKKKGERLRTGFRNKEWESMCVSLSLSLSLSLSGSLTLTDFSRSGAT